jgi:hypothetical protein
MIFQLFVSVHPLIMGVAAAVQHDEIKNKLQREQRKLIFTFTFFSSTNSV